MLICDSSFPCLQVDYRIDEKGLLAKSKEDIDKCCNDKKHFCGEDINGTKLVWVTYKKYLSLVDNNIDIEQYINNKLKRVNKNMGNKVICINTGQIYPSYSEAGKQFNLNRKKIKECCDGKIQHYGTDDNGSKLIWRHYEEYIKESEGVA